MPLTGIEIYKLLPQTNCKECGEPTCLAFAMKLAAGKTELSLCPYVSEDVQAKLAEAAAPPIRVVTVGSGGRAVKIGGEMVMFRHEKRFENQPGLAILISDSMAETEVNARLEKLNKFQYERVGLTLRPEMVAIKNDSGEAAKFEALTNKVTQKSDASLILMSDNPDVLAAGLKACADRKPLLYAASKENLARLADLAKENACPVAAKATNLEELIELTTKLTETGVKDIILDSGARTLRRAFTDQVVIRRAALLKKFRPLGFPTIVLPAEMSDEPMKEAVMASVFVAKYGGIIVLSDFQGESLFPLLVERMNVYTDPQRPLSTTEGIYKIGTPTENSPVLVTTNFSLTYFIVSGEIENSRVPSYLLVKGTGGLSVVTAWAAGKFVADTIAPFVRRSGIEEQIKHRKLIIPGMVAAESGSLEEELPGWEVQVGPREAVNIAAYLKQWRP